MSNDFSLLYNRLEQDNIFLLHSSKLNPNLYCMDMYISLSVRNRCSMHDKFVHLIFLIGSID